MPDVAEQLRRSAAREAASYQPSPDLPRRIARRTLQLQRQRRAKVVGGAAILTAAILAFTLVVRPVTHASNAVSIAAGPVNLAAKDDASTLASTTTTLAPLPLLDLQGFIDQGIAARNQAIRQFVAALKKKQQRERDAADAAQAGAQVLDASIARGPAFAGFPPGTPTTRKRDDPTSTTSSTRPTGTTTTTDATTTTTTTATVPNIPLAIAPPDHVCAGIPAVFHAAGTGADLVVWSNMQVGATAVYVLTESVTITARLQLGGSTSTQSYGVQVIPTGTPPC